MFFVMLMQGAVFPFPFGILYLHEKENVVRYSGTCI